MNNRRWLFDTCQICEQPKPRDESATCELCEAQLVTDMNNHVRMRVNTSDGTEAWVIGDPNMSEQTALALHTMVELAIKADKEQGGVWPAQTR